MYSSIMNLDCDYLFNAMMTLFSSLMAFGAGRRVCPGETLARNRLFLFTATLLQKFTFLPPEDSTPLPTNPRDYHLSLALEPKPYKIKAIPRELI